MRGGLLSPRRGRCTRSSEDGGRVRADEGGAATVPLLSWGSGECSVPGKSPRWPWRAGKAEPWWGEGRGEVGKSSPGLAAPRLRLTSTLGWVAAGLSWHSAGMCDGMMVRAWPQLPSPIFHRGYQIQGQCGQRWLFVMAGEWDWGSLWKVLLGMATQAPVQPSVPATLWHGQVSTLCPSRSFLG
ncbi:hypothetical protein H1C71_018895 [Ictidomys tridecemlineatus]|nr:hypothetical protein H1C71_018895 [Ictidomys tridecemlineatus]